jgi:hypothetical protein
MYMKMPHIAPSILRSFDCAQDAQDAQDAQGMPGMMIQSINCFTFFP